MIHPDFQIVIDWFGENNCVFNVNSLGVSCKIQSNQTKYKFIASTCEQLLSMIAEEFSSSDESYDGEFATYTRWTDIEGLEPYFESKHKVI